MDVAAEYRLEEITVQPGSAGAPQTVGDVRGGSYIVGVRHADGSFRPQPAADTLLAAGDVVMAIGTPRTLERLEELFTSRRRRADRRLAVGDAAVVERQPLGDERVGEQLAGAGEQQLVLEDAAGEDDDRLVAQRLARWRGRPRCGSGRRRAATSTPRASRRTTASTVTRASRIEGRTRGYTSYASRIPGPGTGIRGVCMAYRKG